MESNNDHHSLSRLDRPKQIKNLEVSCCDLNTTLLRFSSCSEPPQILLSSHEQTKLPTEEQRLGLLNQFCDANPNSLSWLPSQPSSNKPSSRRFRVYGEYVSGSISDEQRMQVVRNSCPGAGACGGMYTANTMACAIETLGMSLPYSSSTPAEDPLKLVECRLAGNYLVDLLKMDLKPRDIITPKSLRNVMVIVMALGGSTNAVLHLIAIARPVGLELTLDDFQKVSDKFPFVADLKPSGKYVMEDVHNCCR